MRGEQTLLRIGGYLVGRACRRLPRKIRDDRYREWMAELPAILHDPEVRLGWHRALRMLCYAADTSRGAARAPGRPRRRRIPLSGLLTIAALTATVYGIWNVVHAPGNAGNYLQVAWSLLLLAWLASDYTRLTARMTALIAISAGLAGAADGIWNVAKAPGDWVNYLQAVLLSLLFLLPLAWLIRHWTRIRRA